MNKFFTFLSGCFILQQTCGNYLIAIDVKTKQINACNTITLECGAISYLELMVLRQTNSCSKSVYVDPLYDRRC